MAILWYQGRIKRRGHAIPDTVPIDIKIVHPDAHVKIDLQALEKVYEYCYSAMLHQSEDSAPSAFYDSTATPSMPTAYS